MYSVRGARAGLLVPGILTATSYCPAQVIHGRWAMLGAAGCIAPEILGQAGVIPESTGIVWFRSGVIPPAGSYDNYFMDSYSLFFIEVVLMQFAELKRLQDYRNPGSQAKQDFVGLERFFGGSGNPAYPGTRSDQGSVVMNGGRVAVC